MYALTSMCSSSFPLSIWQSLVLGYDSIQSLLQKLQLSWRCFFSSTHCVASQSLAKVNCLWMSFFWIDTSKHFMLNCLLITEHHSIPSIFHPYTGSGNLRTPLPSILCWQHSQLESTKERYLPEYGMRKGGKVFLLLFWLWRHTCGWVVLWEFLTWRQWGSSIVVYGNPGSFRFSTR